MGHGYITNVMGCNGDSWGLNGVCIYIYIIYIVTNLMRCSRKWIVYYIYVDI